MSRACREFKFIGHQKPESCWCKILHKLQRGFSGKPRRKLKILVAERRSCENVPVARATFGRAFLLSGDGGRAAADLNLLMTTLMAGHHRHVALHRVLGHFLGVDFKDMAARIRNEPSKAQRFYGGLTTTAYQNLPLEATGMAIFDTFSCQNFVRHPKVQIPVFQWFAK